jgi:hypothetical protein
MPVFVRAPGRGRGLLGRIGYGLLPGAVVAPLRRRSAG